MAASARPTDAPLIRELLAEPHRFSFFQAVSLLERACPDAPSVGGPGPASRERIRFRPEIEMGFPPASIATVEALPGPGDGEMRFRLTSALFGLYGSESPLPNYWSEDLLREQPDTTLVRDFLDIFHHRVYSLFYRIWSKYRYHIQFRTDGRDAFSERMLALIGFASAPVREACDLPLLRLVRYAGLLVQKPRSALGMEVFVSDWLGGVRTRVTACTGRWVTIREADRNRLGIGPSSLGMDLTIGERYHDRSGQYRVTIGPVGYAAYRTFLPGEAGYRTLRSLTNLFEPDRLDAELEVRLEGPEVPPLHLAAADPPRLGWTSWLLTGPSPEVGTCFPIKEIA